jgi:hypothetical protein
MTEESEPNSIFIIMCIIGFISFPFIMSVYLLGVDDGMNVGLVLCCIMIISVLMHFNTQPIILDD